MGSANGEELNVKEFLTAEEKDQKAKLVTARRILSDADFKKIEATQLRKQVQAFRKGKKGKKRTIRGSQEDEDAESMPGKRREGREKFGSRKGKKDKVSSTSNKEKLKHKNFMMVKSKFKAKAKKSFVQKQKELKKAMMRSQKFK